MSKTIGHTMVTQEHIQLAAPLALPLCMIANATLRIVDFMRFGSIINVYARKVSV